MKKFYARLSMTLNLFIMSFLSILLFIHFLLNKMIWENYFQAFDYPFPIFKEHLRNITNSYGIDAEAMKSVYLFIQASIMYVWLSCLFH